MGLGSLGEVRDGSHVGHGICKQYGFRAAEILNPYSPFFLVQT